MDKLKYLLLVLTLVLFIPFIAFAEGDKTEAVVEDDDRVVIYFFHGATCSHCAEAKEWFASIEEEYGSMYRIEYYEVWNDEDNAACRCGFSASDRRNDYRQTQLPRYRITRR